MPVLFLVMDGMSAAVFRELIGDIVRRGNWLECGPGSVPVPTALLATVPSITEISRRALFRGRLHPDSTPTEQSAFATNDGLFSRCGGQSRPVLFLKKDLQDSGTTGLSVAVKQAIGNKKCRVVAMVLNAIDDHLSGSDQIAMRWNLDSLRPLREVLQVAAEAGRAIILTSDHGHVLEHKTALRQGMSIGGDRYREDGGAPKDGEIGVSGARIQTALGRPSIVAAWSRDIRYSSKKRGYHGGVSPQEIVVPIAVLRHLSSTAPAGWRDISPSPYLPDWWKLEREPMVESELATASEPTVEAKQVAGLALFDHAAVSSQSEDWIAKLLDGEIYKVQSTRAVRGVPDRELVTKLLQVLSARGGSMPREALAERLGMPLLRLNGLVPNLARVFNVDGYDVLALDTTSGTVTLNVTLLRKQFAVGD